MENKFRIFFNSLVFIFNIFNLSVIFFVYSAFYPFYSLINIDKHISPRDQELRRRTRNAAFEAGGIGKALKADGDWHGSGPEHKNSPEQKNQPGAFRLGKPPARTVDKVHLIV